MDNIKQLNAPEYRHFIFDKVSYQVGFTVPSYIINSLTVDTYYSTYQNDVITRFMYSIPQLKDYREETESSTTEVEEVARYPATFFDYIKLHYFPAKWLRKYPVKYKIYDKRIVTKNIKQYNITKLFPDMSFDGDYKRLTVAVMEDIR